MIRSMTGFGLDSKRAARFAVKAEVYSVNNRNLRISVRLPERIQSMEPEIEEMLRNSVSRGTVNVTVAVDDLSGDPGYVLDQAAVKYYRDELKKLKAGKIPLSVLVALPGAVRKKALEEIPEELAALTRKALKSAVKQMLAARETEGAATWKDMKTRCAEIRRLIESIEARIPCMIENYRNRLSERLKKLLNGVNSTFTEEDIRKEIALFADRSDVSEEIARLRSHLALMDKAGNHDEAYGRKLEFITQEMFREGNTIASKATDAEMVQEALNIKSEIEKLREQALNVE